LTSPKHTNFTSSKNVPQLFSSCSFSSPIEYVSLATRCLSFFLACKRMALIKLKPSSIWDKSWSRHDGLPWHGLESSVLRSSFVSDIWIDPRRRFAGTFRLQNNTRQTTKRYIINKENLNSIYLRLIRYW